jgi:predicted AlkP superfamily pyrophosphatase or phosphodiesterase
MSENDRKLLVVAVAALGQDLLERAGRTSWQGLAFRPMPSVMPALTCTAQATFRTASPPARHGMVANGLYVRSLAKPMFWEQSARLVAGERIWGGYRESGRTVGMMFWQQSMGEPVDLLVTPAPIHKHHGGMIMDCYARPAGLYDRLCRAIGSRFKLHRYWGPMASARVGDWIVNAVEAVLADPGLSPDLLLAYLPSLDYDLQRHGPAHPRADAAIQRTFEQLDGLLTAARRAGYELLLFGDYAIAPCPGGACRPNLALREAGLLVPRDVGGRQYPDFHASAAWCMVDHEIAHVYVPDRRDIERTEAVLAALPGIGEVVSGDALAGLGLDHPNAGELVCLADGKSWLAYPWWTDPREAPDFATHVDIHNKPGFDPCELNWGWPWMSVSTDPSRIAGTHGLVGPGREVAWTSSLPLPREPADLADLAALTRDWLEEAR